MRRSGIRFANTAAWAEDLVTSLAEQPTAVSEAELAVLQAQLAALRNADAAPTPAAGGDAVCVVRQRHELTRVAKSLAASPAIAVHLEMSHPDARRGEIIGLALAAAEEACYVPTGHRFGAANELLADQVGVAEAADALHLGRWPLIAHGAKGVLKWLRRHTAVTPTFIWDTAIAARLLRSDLTAGLVETAVRELGVPAWNLSVPCAAHVQFLPIDVVAEVCIKNAQNTLALWQRQQTCLA